MNQQQMKTIIRPLSRLIIVFFIFNSHLASADPMSLYAKAGTWNFAMKTPGKSVERISGVGAYQSGLGVGMMDHFVFDVAFNVLASKGFGGQLGIGFDFGARYFPFSYNGNRKISEGPLTIEMAEQWRPYVGAGFRQRQFVLVITSQFVGPGFMIGTEYRIDRKWFGIGEFRMDYMAGQSKSEAVQTNILFGLGREI